jgi:membrane-associated phospholipid phosphatase
MHIAPVRHLARRLLHPAPALLLAGVALLALAVTTSASVVHLDAGIGRAVRGLSAGLPLDLRFAVSELGATDFVMPLTLAAAAVLMLVRNWRGALTLVLAVLATQGVVQLIKLLVERPRPAANGNLAEASGFSFPSAHSATSMAVYATLTFLLARMCHGGARAAVVVGGVGLVLAVGLSRVLVAAHYPVDVLAGWLTGGALVVASWLLVRRFVRVRATAPA